jgi:AraC-like DNA-binding protein
MVALAQMPIPARSRADEKRSSELQIEAASFTDPDAYAGFLPSTRVQLTITKPGKLKAHATRIQLGELWLQRFSDNLPRTAHAVGQAGRLVFSFRTSDGPPLTWGGVAMKVDTFLHHGHRLEAFQCSSGDAAWASISIPSAMWSKAAGTSPEFLTQSPGPTNLRLQEMKLRRIKNLHAAVSDLAMRSPELLENEKIFVAVQESLTDALLDGLASSREDRRRPAAHERYALIRRFISVLNDNPDAPFHMAELSTMLGVSDRTLRDYCQEQLGVSPYRYLMLRRMNLARKALLEEAPNTITVTEIAMRYGFWEIGRFAVVYKSIYGESPGSTLRTVNSPPVIPVTSYSDAWVTTGSHSAEARRPTLQKAPPPSATSIPIMTAMRG